MFQSIVIMFYLMDNETSWMILMSNVMGVALEGWKICQASTVVRIDTFPYVSITDSQSYSESETK